MRHILDLERWPLDELGGAKGEALVAHCREELREADLFSLDALIRPDALETSVADVAPVLDAAAFTHSRDHNIYFVDEIEGLDPDHPALRRFTTINHTICGDQIQGSVITRIYEWQPLIDFLAAVMGKSRLYPMADPLGRINVMAYHEGEQLNWHFDRAEFTTTVLLQAPASGGEFQYRSVLRSESDPNYDGVARLLAGEDERVQILPLQPGTLNVFKGKNTAHRVTPVEGDRPRIVAVFSYYEDSGFRVQRCRAPGLLRSDGSDGITGSAARPGACSSSLVLRYSPVPCRVLHAGKELRRRSSSLRSSPTTVSATDRFRARVPIGIRMFRSDSESFGQRLQAPGAPS